MAVLNELDVGGVFSTELRENLTVIRFVEECTRHFSVNLNKRHLKELIGELESLHDQMGEVA